MSSSQTSADGHELKYGMTVYVLSNNLSILEFTLTEIDIIRHSIFDESTVEIYEFNLCYVNKKILLKLIIGKLERKIKHLTRIYNKYVNDIEKF